MKKLAIILISGTVFLISIIGLMAWLSWQPQSWYSPPDYSKQEVKRLADRAEYRLQIEFQAVRKPEEKDWQTRITDKEVNAWLSGRLEDWLTHNQDLNMPEDIKDIQVHATPEGLWVAAMVEIDDSEPRPVATKLNIWIENGKAFVEPVAIRFGKIPIPLSLLKELFKEMATKTEQIDPIVPLQGWREVEIKEVEFEDGAVTLTCRTYIPQ